MGVVLLLRQVEKKGRKSTKTQETAQDQTYDKMAPANALHVTG